MDKTEIMEIARRIGTYETSILPYEDCCTVFTPRHPVTRPKLNTMPEAESQAGRGGAGGGGGGKHGDGDSFNVNGRRSRVARFVSMRKDISRR